MYAHKEYGQQPKYANPCPSVVPANVCPRNAGFWVAETCAHLSVGSDVGQRVKSNLFVEAVRRVCQDSCFHVGLCALLPRTDMQSLHGGSILDSRGRTVRWGTYHHQGVHVSDRVA